MLRHMMPIIPRMQPDGLAANPLAESAKGWHNIQLAVMGFIGLCGVLSMGATPDAPPWLQWWSAGMAGLAILSSLISTWMVGTVAFPFYGASGPAAPMPTGAPGRLRGGIVMTFVSIVLMVFSSISGWWPGAPANGGSIEIQDARGASVCGTLVDGAPAGMLRLQTAERLLTIDLGAVTQMSPVSSC